jgi:hypothetical protein
MHTARSRTSLLAGLSFCAALVATAFAGCGGKGSGPGFSTYGTGTGPGAGDASASGGSSSLFGNGGDASFVLALDGDVPDRAPPPAACKLPGLWCYQTTAPCVTSLSGTVFDPAGQVPLSNVVVYVPADPSIPLDKITTGTNSCSACTTEIKNYMALAVTDVNGHFSMTGVPATTSVPVVVQVGKWRRKTTLATVTRCGPNKVADGTLRLPRSKAEGDIPQMAVSTGGADDLGCFLRGMGLDASEYGAPLGTGRLDVYQGVGGPGLTAANGTAGNCGAAGCPLWASKAALEHYDIVLLACEGGENGQTKPAASLTAMHDWLGEGGKVFATHFHYYWFNNGPTDFQNVATWLGFSAGIGFGNYTIDTSFQRGTVFDQWLAAPGVGAATGTSIALTGVANSVSAVSANATRWIYDPNTSNTKYLSFLTPIGGSKVTVDGGAEKTVYCGKAVFSDLHTSGQPSPDVPGSCPTTLTAQQKALEYLFFDLAACVAPENVPPPMPPPNPPPPPPPPM